jgi:chitin synthase
MPFPPTIVWWYRYPQDNDDPERGKSGVIGPLSVSTIYLVGMASIFVIAGLLHPKEILALCHGIWYLLCLPAGYLLLTMYVSNSTVGEDPPSVASKSSPVCGMRTV